MFVLHAFSVGDHSHCSLSLGVSFITQYLLLAGPRGSLETPRKKGGSYGLSTLTSPTPATQLGDPDNPRSVNLLGIPGRTGHYFSRTPSAAPGEDDLCGSVRR